MHTVCLFHLAFISSDLKGEPSQAHRFLITNKPKQSGRSASPVSLRCPLYSPSAGYRVHNPGSGSGETTDLSQGGVRHHAGLLAEGAAAAAEH